MLFLLRKVASPLTNRLQVSLQICLLHKFLILFACFQIVPDFFIHHFGHLQFGLIFLEIVSKCATDLAMQQALTANGLRVDHLPIVRSLADIPSMRHFVGPDHLYIAATWLAMWHAMWLHRCEQVLIAVRCLWLQ